MSEKDLVRVWQWLGLVLVTVTTTFHSAVSGRVLGFWGAMPEGVLYEPASVYGIIIGAPLYVLVCWIAGLIAADRRSLTRWRRIPEVFGLTVVPGRPLARAVPLIWLALFVLLPTFSLGHFLRKFLKAYPRHCWTDWHSPPCATLASSKGHRIDVVPGFEPYSMLLLVAAAGWALSFFVLQVVRRTEQSLDTGGPQSGSPPSAVVNA